jgi:hypothetical protein
LLNLRVCFLLVEKNYFHQSSIIIRQLGINPQFIDEYLVAIEKTCSINLAAWGTRIIPALVEDSDNGIEFRPLIVNARGRLIECYFDINTYSHFFYYRICQQRESEERRGRSKKEI